MRTLFPALLAFALVGCSGQPAPTASPVSPTAFSSSPTTTPSSTPTAPAETPLETPTPLDPAVVGLTCGGDVRFHPDLLSRPGTAESDPDPAGAALRAYLAQAPPEIAFPSTGWVRVAQLADRVLFVAEGADATPWVQLELELQQGTWRDVTAGQCHLAPAAPAGVSVAAWWLDPGFPRPDAGATQVRALLVEQACASGTSPEGRVLPPSVTLSAESVIVTMLVRHRPGGQDCPGNPQFPLVIELPEPLGERELLDGGTFPPRDATAPGPG